MVRYQLGDIVKIKYGKDHKRLKEGNIPVYGTGGIMRYVDTELYNKKSVLIPRKGSLGNLFLVTEPFWTVDTLFYTEIDESLIIPEFLFYKLKTFDLVSMNVGSAVPSLTTSVLNALELNIPSLKIQSKIVSILKAFDKKIENNKKINHHLEQMATSIFENMFPNVSSGKSTIGNYIIPKRGKNLLSKDAIVGKVPVVAGGLQPSTFHNIANTKSPVLTISASGANAGYVNLWHIPVWSSDSSYIDTSITDNVYFWYVMLKKRQQEIYDSQTGSAQPHIYPKHIEIMPTIDLSEDKVSRFTKQVTPLFESIGNNIKEIGELQTLRDTLLPKLLSGEIPVNQAAK
ncbi:restriction endonuclease subunit S [Streptococcus intermedius]|uniref:restriction endonuclease subunit S n=2 Tax=Streptococcus intermedius TaxID=1338 RepID=UPI00023297C5|nr:restriction endonuclease subunit S [Streptococcus intermedius]EHG12911.1 hypothetical protein HMPREF9177_00724 [Streptococcus intermedius F0413]QKH77967.1 restriction endonuclease subunit S [Streptococcus intermedius]